MTRLAICRNCGKLVRLDEALCSGCGQRRPEGGWLAEPTSSPPPRGKKGMIVLGIVATIAAVGIVPLWGTHSLLSLDQPWFPQVGKTAQLAKSTVLCRTHALLEDIGAELFHDQTGEAETVSNAKVAEGSVPRGCFLSKSSSSVTVVDLKGLSVPTARVRLPHGNAYWVFRTALRPPGQKPPETQAQNTLVR